ncbi:MAG: exodeoxyribonuclease III [Candidatus Eisenbacteria bacterium]|uniref:Exodeoxyribonuclease III n=1 Tax=Eiseniibacteriota bacterium TaxID=2212470 RepID=A0A956RNC9_UNCEI|nr:exodeoxyribonuclease III [Candidatus Eisenbacteria bacterium]
MRIATWNVNSIRARLPRLQEWLGARQPDVLCVQETKCTDDEFPEQEVREMGYEVAFHGQKTYNGVALLSKHPISNVIRGFPGDGEEARFISGRIRDVQIASVYVINGETVGSEKYARKLEWLKKLRDHLNKTCAADVPWMLAGDFNITFDDRDVYDPAKWHERIFCTTRERDALKAIVDLGCRDALRKYHHRNGIYTWFDFRTGGYQRGQGLRIDHVLVSTPLFKALRDVEVDLAERGAEKPSDHAPVIATLALD